MVNRKDTGALQRVLIRTSHTHSIATYISHSGLLRSGRECASPRSKHVEKCWKNFQKCLRPCWKSTYHDPRAKVRMWKKGLFLYALSYVVHYRHSQTSVIQLTSTRYLPVTFQTQDTICSMTIEEKSVCFLFVYLLSYPLEDHMCTLINGSVVNFV